MNNEVKIGNQDRPFEPEKNNEDVYQLEIRQQLAKEHDAEYVSAFYCDRAYVKRREKYFFIDREGKRINDEEYDEVRHFSEGLAAVKQSIEDSCGQWFYIDPSGKRVNEVPYSSAGDYSEGLAAVHIGQNPNPYQESDGIGLSGNGAYVNKMGEVVIEGPFTGGSPFKNGFAEVGHGFETGCKGCYGRAVIDKRGQTVLDHGDNGSNAFIRLSSASSERIEENFIFEDELDPWQCAAYELTGDCSLFPLLEDEWGLKNSSERVFPATFGKYTFNTPAEAKAVMRKILSMTGSYHNRFSDKLRYRGLFRIEDSDSGQGLDHQLHSELIYLYSHPEFSEGRIAVMLPNHQWVYIGEDGKRVDDKAYADAESFRYGVAKVRCENETGYRLIRSDGSFVCEPEFSYISRFRDGVAEAVLDGRNVLIDTSGQVVFGQTDYALTKELAARHPNWCSQCEIPESDGYTRYTKFEFEDQYYYVSGAGEVFIENNLVMSKVEDPCVVLEVLKLVEEDKTITEARDRMAELLSKGDEKLTAILRWHTEFNSGHIDTCPTVKAGIAFYQVGRNASHEFYLGVKDGKVYGCSVGEGCYDNETGQYELDESEPYEVDLNNPGYMGHY